MPLAIASLFFFFFSIHSEQTNYVKQKIDGLWNSLESTNGAAE
jgi:hypothetical protein